MGYYYSQREAQRFFIAAENLPALVSALERYTSAYGLEETYDWIDASHPQSMRLAEASTAWMFTFDESGNVIALTRNGESKEYYDDFLKVLAPFVQDGSFLEMAGENEDDIFRLVFKNSAMRKVMATITFNESQT